jgi:hypothetical protein
MCTSEISRFGLICCKGVLYVFRMGGIPKKRYSFRVKFMKSTRCKPPRQLKILGVKFKEVLQGVTKL